MKRRYIFEVRTNRSNQAYICCKDNDIQKPHNVKILCANIVRRKQSRLYFLVKNHLEIKWSRLHNYFSLYFPNTIIFNKQTFAIA